MLQCRPLFHCGLLVLAILPAAAWPEGRVGFLSPSDGEIVAGLTEFAFEVQPGTPEVDRIDVYVQKILTGSALPPDWRFSSEVRARLVGEKIVAVAYANGTVLEKASIVTSELAFGSEVDVTLVELFPIVTTRQGGYVSGLSREDFLVFDEGEEVELYSFAEQATSLGVAVLVDVSGSMLDKLASVQDASCQFIDELSPTDRVSVYAFNHSLSRHLDLAEDHLAAKAQIRGLAADGGTAFYDAIVRVSDDFSGLRGRKALIVFSDGRDERSLSTLQRAVETSLKSEVIIYAVGAGETEEDLAARDDLRELAELTGGQAHFIHKMRGLRKVFDSILEDLRAQYSMSFAPVSSAPGFHRVVVQVRGGDKLVRVRKGYFNRSRDE